MQPSDLRAPSARLLAVALAVLLALTAVSWLLAHVPLGGASTPIALAIAAIKASIVAIAFMELHHASTPARVTVFVTLSFIALLAAGAVTDVLLR